MEKIILVDPNEGGIAGHNKKYRDAINAIEDTVIYSKVAKFPPMLRSPFNGYKSRMNYFNEIPESEVVCVLQIDSIYMTPPLFSMLRENHKHVVGVLHWFPRDKKRQLLFRISAKQLDMIVCHSEYIKQQLNKIGVYNVKVIEYPAFCDVNIDNLRKKDSEGKKVFTCLGGSRKDKGPDVLAQSFRYIPEKYRSNIKIVIAGKQLDVPYSFIEKKAEESDIAIEFCDKRMTDEEYWQYIIDSDVILLPYKKIFTGNSGPMTDGVFLNKYILGPDEGNIGYLINKYNLGSTFEIENFRSLGEEIGATSQKNTDCNHSYRRRLSVERFIGSYQELFDSMI